MAEIAFLQPVRIEALPEHRVVSAANLGITVRRLIAVGLVKRYRTEDQSCRYLLTLNDGLGWASELQACLRAMGASRLKASTRPIAPPALEREIREGSNVTGLRIFGRPAGDIETIFGHPNRTMALFIITALGAADPSTVARVVGVRVDGDMHRLMDPIEADGLISSRMVGGVRLCSLRETSWTSPLRRLVGAILDEDGVLASRMQAANVMFRSGKFSSRVHLRRRLGLEPPG